MAAVVRVDRIDVLDSEPTRENSYGIIPIRISPGVSLPAEPGRKLSTANTQVLLIFQKTIIPSHPPLWTFPKGHAERQDKSILHTAIREVREETGVIVREEGILFKDAEPLSERYRNPRKGWAKEVRYWVALVEGQGEDKLELQEAELVDAKWLDWADALELITFERTKGLLKRAMDLLDGRVSGAGDEKLVGIDNTKVLGNL